MRKAPTKKELDEAIARHVKQSAETVAKIPPEKRTILTLAEANERQKDAKNGK